MRLIETEIDIAAPVSRVWNVLTDFSAYPDWNPFITDITGELRVGARLRVRIQPPGRRAIMFRPVVLTALPNLQLRWLGRLPMPGLLDGEHSFRLSEKGLTCRFYQSERFTGVLVPLMGQGLWTATERGFDEMNAALKTRVEAKV
jgi:hypothetical protein